LIEANNTHLFLDVFEIDVLHGDHECHSGDYQCELRINL